MINDYDKYLILLDERLNTKRFIHSLNVSRAAVDLARKYGVDEEKARLAGLLHDVCKNDSAEKQLQMIQDFGIILDDVQATVPKLWHAICGRVFTENELHITDKDILNAILYHTTARAKMSSLEKIIYLADFISDERDFKGVESLRKAANKDLDKAIYKCLEFSIFDLVKRKMPVHINTIKAFNEAVIEREKREQNKKHENK